MARNDPLRNFRFRLEIDGLQAAGFSEVLIGATTIDVVYDREGTDPPHARKRSALTKYGNLTLKHGVTSSLELFDWFRGISNGQIGSKRRAGVGCGREAGGWR